MMLWLNELALLPILAMAPEGLRLALAERLRFLATVRIASGLVVALVLLSVTGLVHGSWQIPPAGAIAFVSLGGALAAASFECRHGRRIRLALLGVALVMAMSSGLVGIQSALAGHAAPWFIMRPVGALLVLLLCVSLLLGLRRTRPRATAAAIVAGVALTLSLLALLAYVYRVPLAFGSAPAPVPALFGALVLSIGALSAATDQPDLRQILFGQSVRVLLLRSFLPAAVFVLLASEWLDHVLYPGLFDSPALRAGLLILPTVVILAIVIDHSARRVGRTIEAIAAERTAALQDVQRAEAQYRHLFDSLSEGAYRSSGSGRLILANLALRQMLGTGEGDLEGVDLATFYADPADRPRLMQQLEQAGAVRNYELRLRSTDGRVLSVLANSRAVRDEQGSVLFIEGTLTDLSEWRLLEAKYLQAQKMEALGRFSGTIAHDFNNLLTVILGHAEMLRLDHSPGTPAAQDSLGEILAAGTRASALVRRLLDFSRQQPPERKNIKVSQALDRVVPMLDRLLGDEIVLDVKLGNRDAHVCVDPGQFEQVLMNLAVNARDAMPEGGICQIITWHQSVEDISVSPVSEPGEYLVMSVRDTGCGMDERVQRHIFEPFFTTKEVGKGTGLGLATVYSIVQGAGGGITVHSSPGAGTQFHLYFPSVAANTAC